MPGDRPSLSAQGSELFLPAVRIRTRAAVIYATVFLVFVVATADSLRTFFKDFIIHERALLTPRGRERFRTRRRDYDRTQLCDENDEPKMWLRPFRPFFNSGWRSLSSCVEYDLSLRRRPLGDEGTRRLVGLLGRREYATRDLHGQLRVLNLERQDITRRGAGYLARWLSVDPVEATDGEDGETADLVDVERMPTAASRSIFINLRGNPIGILGVKDLERAVEKARINGIRVIIVGGGSSSDDILAVGNGGKTGRHVHVVKLGPIEYTRRSVEMQPWRLPVPLLQRLGARVEARWLAPSLRALVVFCVGFSIGRASVGKIPYRLVVLRADGEGGARGNIA